MHLSIFCGIPDHFLKNTDWPFFCEHMYRQPAKYYVMVVIARVQTAEKKPPHGNNRHEKEAFVMGLKSTSYGTDSIVLLFGPGLLLLLLHTKNNCDMVR